MGKVKHKIAVYGKMYGCTLPTVKKLEDVGAVTDIITVAYNVGYSDAKTQNNRLTQKLKKLLWTDTTRQESFRTGLLIQ